MTDFMRWLYINCIKPELEHSGHTGYETPLSLMDSCLDAQLFQQYEQALECYSIHAFLLGFRMGAELTQSSQASFGSTQPSI